MGSMTIDRGIKDNTIEVIFLIYRREDAVSITYSAMVKLYSGKLYSKYSGHKI